MLRQDESLLNLFRKYNRILSAAVASNINMLNMALGARCVPSYSTVRKNSIVRMRI